MAHFWEIAHTIAGHIIVIKGEGSESRNAFPGGFAPFKSDQVNNQLPLFTLETGAKMSFFDAPVLHTFPFEELSCEFATGEEAYEFRMKPVESELIEDSDLILQMPFMKNVFTTNLHPSKERISEFRFLLWMAFGVAAAPHLTVAIHASVVVHQRKAILFLGESGTGKSTHTRLWLDQIPDCKLLNDDSPIVRIENGFPVCPGSPWSGKTPCYLNESYPIAAIVRLRQAPFNRIEKLSKIAAFGALYPSCPPSFAADPTLTDHVCHTLSAIIQKVSVFLLDCLPDSDAAFLVYKTILEPNS